jgi:methionyl-tRNA formyltransferase
LAEGESQPGSITATKDRVLVHCGEGTILEIKEVQPAGKNSMLAIDWARGFNQEKAQFH